MPETDPDVGRPSRNQTVVGVVLLVLGFVLATGLVLGKATVAAGIGYAMGVAGVILIVNSLMRGRRSGPRARS